MSGRFKRVNWFMVEAGAYVVGFVFLIFLVALGGV